MNPWLARDVWHCPQCDGERRLVADGDREKHCPECGWVPSGSVAAGFDEGFEDHLTTEDIRPKGDTAVFRFDYEDEVRYAASSDGRYEAIVIDRETDEVTNVDPDAGELMAWAMEAEDVTILA